MSTDDPHDPASRSRLFRERLWGAAVLVALAVIVLPLLLDGSGSESRFHDLETMREAPPARQPQARTAPASPAEPPAESELAGAEPELARGQPSIDSPSAWIVQAGSFRREVNAVALRDRLRDAGFASFVNQRTAGDGVYRVNVGPMISRERADTARGRVDELLGRESFVGKYP